MVPQAKELETIDETLKITNKTMMTSQIKYRLQTRDVRKGSFVITAMPKKGSKQQH